MEIILKYNIGKKSKKLVFVPEKNLLTGKRIFTKEYGDPSSLEEDLMNIASAVYASDLSNKRGERENFCRNFDLDIPVDNYVLFNGLKSELESLLYNLTDDNWNFNFIKEKSEFKDDNLKFVENNGVTLLFSGGLDSLAAAVYLEDVFEKILLVSHITHNRVIKESQEELFKLLKNRNKFKRIAFHVSGRNIHEFEFATDNEREDTQRSRSFMFLCLAATIARREGHHKIIFIGENGQMAIHLPLTSARMGAFSTRTAHPKFLSDISIFLQNVYSYKFSIENPFIYKTKTEVVKILSKKHSTLIPYTISCWRASRVKGGKKHCGECIPCIIRRISIESNGIKLNEYLKDIFEKDLDKLPNDDIGKINLTDLLEFITWFDGSYNENEIVDNFPGLYSQYFSVDDAIKMYKRFSNEAKKIFQNYPKINKYL